MDKKYTFGEWVFMMCVGGGTLVLGMVISVPLFLLSAWMRSEVWNWFMVPYFHLPRIGVWLMLAVGIFVAFFRPSVSPELKKEYYEASPGLRIATPIIWQLLSFATAYLIHIWVLKG